MDRVLVFHRGRIVEDGRHRELETSGELLSDVAARVRDNSFAKSVPRRDSSTDKIAPFLPATSVIFARGAILPFSSSERSDQRAFCK